MPNFGHGKSAVILMNGVKMSNYLKSLDSDITTEKEDATVFNSSGWKSYIAGNKDATISGDGLFDVSGIDLNLNTALGSTNTKIWTHWPQGTSTGLYGFGMECYKTKYGIKTPVEGVVSLSVDGQSKVAKDRIVSLYSLSSLASSCGNGSSVDNTAATTIGGVGYLQRTDTGAGNITTPIIQHSSAGVTWATLLSFSAASAQTGQRVAVSGTIKRYTRFKWTKPTGITAIANVGFSRK